MPLRITFKDGDRAGQSLEYGDELDRIDFGRDPQKCRIVFPPNLVAVGREHFALRRVVGRWRIVLSGVHAVLVNGAPAREDQELPGDATVQVGADGPVLKIVTVGNMALPDTMPQGARVPSGPGRDTMVRGLDRSLRSMKLLVAVVFVLLVAALGVVGVGWWYTQKKMTDINERQAAVISDLKDKQNALNEKIQPRVTDALAKAASSVYLVVIRDEQGHEQGAATAWAVGKDVLGTNAHVARLHTELRAGQTLLARSNAVPPRDFVINRVKIHPGYDDFQKIWTAYQPTKDSLGPTIEQLQQVLACDVALMWIESGEGFAAPLTIAEPGVVEALNAGDVIGYVGYPMESMAMGGVNVKQPTPTMQVGNVTAMTDFFMMKSASGSQLVQISLPVMGGASGSPILNADGRVVALVSAANLTSNPAGGGRISTGAGVNFGQRVDLLAEMLDNRADEVQKARSDRWREEIKQFVSMRDKMVDVQVSRWMQGHKGRTAERIAQEVGSLDKAYKNIWIWKTTVKVPAGGDYCFVAVCGSDIAIQEYVFNAPGAEWTTANLLGSDNAPNWYSVIPVAMAGAKTVEVVVSAAKQNVPVTLHVYRAK